MRPSGGLLHRNEVVDADERNAQTIRHFRPIGAVPGRIEVEGFFEKEVYASSLVLLAHELKDLGTLLLDPGLTTFWPSEILERHWNERLVPESGKRPKCPGGVLRLERHNEIDVLSQPGSAVRKYCQATDYEVANFELVERTEDCLDALPFHDRGASNP